MRAHAAADALRSLQDSFATAASGDGDPPTCWGEVSELQRRFPADSPHVLNLNALSRELLPLPEGSVCRFICHVQQPLNPECFVGAVYRGGHWESSKFRESLPESAATGSKSVLWTRQAYRCCVIPGAATWWQRQQQTTQQEQQQGLALRECVVLLYPTEGVTPPKLNEAIDVVGFCWGGTDAADDQFLSPSNTCVCGAPWSLRSKEASGRPEGAPVLRLHAFFFRRLLPSSPERPFCQQIPKQIVADSWELQRQRVISLLKGAFDGDALAAEYGLLVLCSRPVLEQQEAGMAFHRLRVAFLRPHSAEASSATQEQLRQSCEAAAAAGSEASAATPAAVNVSAPPSAGALQTCICPFLTCASRRLLKNCKALVPCATAVSAHPEALLQQRLSPQLRLADGDVYEDVLSATPLQLAPGSVVVVDEPQSLERGALELLLRQRATASAAPATVANQKGKEETTAVQKTEIEEKVGDAKNKQQQQLEMELFQQEIGASFSALQMLITDGSVPYDFVAGIRPIATDCSVILFTHGGRDSYFDGLIRVPVVASNEAQGEEESEPDKEEIQELRQFISAARDCGAGVRLHPDLRETAVTDFVLKRQQYDDISSDDFQHWLLVASAVAASHGSFARSSQHTDEVEESQAKAGLSSDANGLEVVVEPKHWQHAQKLEDERRRRLRAFRQEQESNQRSSQLKNAAASLVERAATWSLT